MPYEEEDPPHVEPDPEINALTAAIIGAAIEVHRQLGPGLEESLYQAAMEIEFNMRNITFLRQALVDVRYKGHLIGDRRLDFIVGGLVVVELKAVEQLAAVHKAQGYLKLTGLKVGLLINFNTSVLKDGIKRIIRA